MEGTREKEELLREIERYFDCQLTDEEERRLRERIRHTQVSHPAVEEAKALMGFSTISGSVTNGEKVERGIPFGKMPAWIKGMAASLLLLIAGGCIFLIADGSEEGGEYIAYINGKYVTDEETVLAALMDNMGEFNEGMTVAREDAEGELEDFSPFAECVESDFGPDDI